MAAQSGLWTTLNRPQDVPGAPERLTSIAMAYLLTLPPAVAAFTTASAVVFRHPRLRQRFRL
jgi:hypothetical protein